MAFFAMFGVLAALFAAAPAGASSAARDADLLAADGECTAGSDSDCGLSALQMRAKRTTQGLPADPYNQCGGAKWTGTTECTEGYKCAGKDKWYSQCIAEGEELPAPSVHADASSPDVAKPTGTMEPLVANPPTPDPPAGKTLNSVVIKSNFLYDSVTGERFFAKGTSYNPRSAKFKKDGRSRGSSCEPGEAQETAYTADIIADEFEERWTEDLKAIANMGANTVRLFNVDAGRDHTKFMKTAESFGIYVIIPLNSKDYGFLPAFPSPTCYNANMTHMVTGADGTPRPYGNVGVNVLSYGKQIVKQFSKFPNTLLFTVNNEFAMNDKNGFAGFQCVKALTRDIHRYQKACGASMRRVPLIYSDYDMGPPDRAIVANYLTCALESEDDAIDAYGLNVYSYCENAYPGDGKADNFQYSPYKDIKKDFKDFSVPVLFTEFGCVEGDFLSFCPYKGGRTWPDVKLFFNEEMGEILSGAIAYTYEQDYEERGMVLTPNFLANQTELYLLDSYYALQKEFQAHHVKKDWDGAETSDCKWTPDKVAPVKGKHVRPTCPSTATGHSVMKRRHTSEQTDWAELPPAPDAPLSSIGGQSECPADVVPEALAKEARCHFDA